MAEATRRRRAAYPSEAPAERTDFGEQIARALDAAERSGKRLGAPVTLSPVVRARIAELRAGDLGYKRIAAVLNAEGALTATGKPWTPSTVRGAVASLNYDEHLQRVRK